MARSRRSLWKPTGMLGIMFFHTCMAVMLESGAPVLRTSSVSRRPQNLGLEQGAFLVSDGGLLPPAGRRGQPIGRPNEGKRMNVAKNTPQGRLAELLGTSDIPVDVMATFGGLGFLWGHARAKCGKAATWGLAMIVCGLVLLSKNGYVTIHWDKVQRDCMGTTTYRYNEPRKHGLLATIPPHIQEQTSRILGKLQSAFEHNMGGILWGVASLLIGIRLGAGSADMPA